jgi:hypothetical protein
VTPTLVAVAFARASAFSGEGILFRIKLVVKGTQCGKFIQLPLAKAFFNDGDPVATKRNGTIMMQCGSGYSWDIGGKVSYFGNASGVGGVVMTLAPLGLKDTTAADGSYVFPKVPRSSTPYTISFQKDSGDLREGVSAYDASLILRNVVGLYKFDAFKHQSNTADVNSNVLFTAYDAALILRFIVGINDATSIGSWAMDPSVFTITQHTATNTNIITPAIKYS